MIHRRILVLCACALLGAALAQQQVNSSLALMHAMTTGGSHQVGPGNYWIDRSLDLAEDLVLVGAGAGRTNLFLTGGGPGLRMAAGSVRLQDLTLAYTAGSPGDILHVLGGELVMDGLLLSGARLGRDTTGVKAYGWGSAVYASGEARIHVSRSEFRRHGLVAFELRDGAELRLEDSTVGGNNLGLHAAQAVRLTVVGSRFEGNRAGAVQTVDAVTAELRDNVFSANGVADETTGEEADGLRFGGSSRVLLAGNRILDHPRYAVSAWGRAGIEARGNHFEGNGGAYDLLQTYPGALLLEDGSSLTMVGDVFLRNPGGALELVGDVSAQLEQVRMEGNGSWAFVYLAGAAELRLLHSRLLGHEGSVFVGDGGRLWMEGSEISGSQDSALILMDAAEAHLEDNRLRGNALFGLSMAGGSRATLLRNQIQGNRSGVVLWERSSATLRGNRILDHERSGVAFFDQSGGRVDDNELHGNGLYGILLAGQAEPELGENRFEGNGEDVGREE